MIFATYEEWSKSWVEAAIEENPLIECPDCEGSGVVDCPCCGNESECEECEGEGDFHFNELLSPSSYKPSKQQYYQAVKADLIKLCWWKGEPPFEVMAEFISHFNKQRYT